MVKLLIKPLSANSAFKGRKFRTKEYDTYIRSVLFLLPKMSIGVAPYSIILEFGLSNTNNDLDNNFKPFIDCLVKKYDFDDRQIYHLEATKVMVKKGEEYIKFELLHYSKPNV